MFEYSFSSTRRLQYLSWRFRTNQYKHQMNPFSSEWRKTSQSYSDSKVFIQLKLSQRPIGQIFPFIKLNKIIVDDNARWMNGNSWSHFHFIHPRNIQVLLLMFNKNVLIWSVGSWELLSLQWDLIWRLFWTKSHNNNSPQFRLITKSIFF